MNKGRGAGHAAKTSAQARSGSSNSVVAGSIGYLIGGWHIAAFAQHRYFRPLKPWRLRFPQDWDNASLRRGSCSHRDAELQARKNPNIASAGAITTMRRWRCSAPQPMVPQAASETAADRRPQAADSASADADCLRRTTRCGVCAVSAHRAMPAQIRMPAPKRRRGGVNPRPRRQPLRSRATVSTTGRVTCSTTRRSPASRSGCI